MSITADTLQQNYKNFTTEQKNRKTNTCNLSNDIIYGTAAAGGAVAGAAIGKYSSVRLKKAERDWLESEISKIISNENRLLNESIRKQSCSQSTWEYSELIFGDKDDRKRKYASSEQKKRLAKYDYIKQKLERLDEIDYIKQRYENLYGKIGVAGKYGDRPAIYIGNDGKFHIDYNVRRVGGPEPYFRDPKLSKETFAKAAKKGGIIGAVAGLVVGLGLSYILTQKTA